MSVVRWGLFEEEVVPVAFHGVAVVVVGAAAGDVGVDVAGPLAVGVFEGGFGGSGGGGGLGVAFVGAAEREKAKGKGQKAKGRREGAAGGGGWVGGSHGIYRVHGRIGVG